MSKEMGIVIAKIEGIIQESSEARRMSLAVAMDDYQARFHNTFATLMRIPAFRNLWTAIRSSC